MLLLNNLKLNLKSNKKIVNYFPIQKIPYLKKLFENNFFIKMEFMVN